VSQDRKPSGLSQPGERPDTKSGLGVVGSTVPRQGWLLLNAPENFRIGPSGLSQPGERPDRVRRKQVKCQWRFAPTNGKTSEGLHWTCQQSGSAERRKSGLAVARTTVLRHGWLLLNTPEDSRMRSKAPQLSRTWRRTPQAAASPRVSTCAAHPRGDVCLDMEDSVLLALDQTGMDSLRRPGL
jgi:hypothetical protein